MNANIKKSQISKKRSLTSKIPKYHFMFKDIIFLDIFFVYNQILQKTFGEW